MDELAAETGMNRPSLSAAFGDKGSLYLKTLERYRDLTRNKAMELLGDDPPLRVYLERFYNAALEVYIDDERGARGCYSVGTASTVVMTDPAVRTFLADSIKNTDAFLATLIKKAIGSGEVAEDVDPDALARVATSALHTLAVRSRAGQSREELRNIAATVIDLICRK